MRVALLSALPHSRLDVESAIQNQRKDYVRGILQGYTLSADEIWSNMQPVLEVQAENLFNLCERHGVDVVIRAGKDELATAAMTSKVIILLAHWKGPEVAHLPSDLLAPISALTGPLEQCVDRQIISAEHMTPQGEAIQERAGRQMIASRLNDAIDRWEEWLPFDVLGDGAQTLAISNSFGRNYARSIIDEIFGEKNLLPGARLELADGLWQPADIAEFLPDDWSGFCDFFCCTSEYLAEETKCRRPAATFRADSRYLHPANAFTALCEIIPRLQERTAAGEDFASIYMNIAYQCDLKFGGTSK